MFSLPSGFIASTTGMMYQIFLDLKDLIILGIGLALGFYVINRFIQAMKEGLGK
jgi:hypothetical protein